MDNQEIHEFICLHSVRNFNGDGLDDIAIWCRDRETIHGAETDSVFLYTMRGGTPARIAPEDPLLKSIKSELCRQTPGSPLCASGN